MHKLTKLNLEKSALEEEGEKLIDNNLKTP